MPSGPSPPAAAPALLTVPLSWGGGGGYGGGKVRAERLQPPPHCEAVPNAVLLWDGDDPTGALNQRAGSAARKASACSPGTV